MYIVVDLISALLLSFQDIWYSTYLVLCLKITFMLVGIQLFMAQKIFTLLCYFKQHTVWNSSDNFLKLLMIGFFAFVLFLSDKILRCFITPKKMGFTLIVRYSSWILKALALFNSDVKLLRTILQHSPFALDNSHAAYDNFWRKPSIWMLRILIFRKFCPTHLHIAGNEAQSWYWVFCKQRHGFYM